MLPVDRSACRYIPEHCRAGVLQPGERHGRTVGARLFQRQGLVSRNIAQQCAAIAAGPDDEQGIDAFVVTQADIGPRIHGTLKTAHGHLFDIKRLSARPREYFCAESVRVFPASFQIEFQIMAAGALVGFIAVYESLHVAVVRHQVEVAVVIEIAIGRSVGKTLFREPPGLRDVRKCQVPIIPECVVRYLFTRNGIDQSFKIHIALADDLPFKRRVGGEHEIILVGQVLGDPVRHKKVAPAVVVHVEHQRAPTPVRRFHTTQACYF